MGYRNDRIKKNPKLGKTAVVIHRPRKGRDINYRNTGQHPGNNVPYTMCGGACAYLMLPQQRKYSKGVEHEE